MKNKMIAAAVAVLAGATIFSSCKKTTDEDKTAPTLTITHPVANDTVSASGFHIMATMGDNDDLHEASVSLTSGTDTFLMVAPYVHELSTYTYDTMMMVSVAGVRQATLKIHVEDHHENMTDKSVSFFIKP
ncbi:MAG: hypothetical protein U0T73_12955 [Chitinophagales bacterium]